MIRDSMVFIGHRQIAPKQAACILHDAESCKCHLQLQGSRSHKHLSSKVDDDPMPRAFEQKPKFASLWDQVPATLVSFQ